MVRGKESSRTADRVWQLNLHSALPRAGLTCLPLFFVTPTTTTTTPPSPWTEMTRYAPACCRFAGTRQLSTAGWRHSFFLLSLLSLWGEKPLPWARYR
ncbi:hypothetical protein LY76DRAFT_275222 [Colletotrichum caudatum]|nr:hypothetical protein LY76DRAFT_275222 [Colletotrichum caudatum]